MNEDKIYDALTHQVPKPTNGIVLSFVVSLKRLSLREAKSGDLPKIIGLARFAEGKR